MSGDKIVSLRVYKDSGTDELLTTGSREGTNKPVLQLSSGQVPNFDLLVDK